MEYPNVLNDANLYVDGANWLGKAEVAIPEIAHKVVDMQVMGVAGGMEVPLVGHIDKLKGTIKFKSVDKEALKVLFDSSYSPLLDIRAAIQKYNTQTGKIDYFPIKVSIKGFFNKVKLLAFKQGSDETSDIEYEANYLKIEVSGEEILEIDKFSYVYRVAGKDLLAEVREALGI
ncbi:MAG TPA: phage major tail tube protein [Candidatus Hydrothermia bacterium]|nr:phage major tail tube protein [Candidatus Hydrothermia bacterium]